MTNVFVSPIMPKVSSKMEMMSPRMHWQQRHVHAQRRSASEHQAKRIDAPTSKSMRSATGTATHRKFASLLDASGDEGK